MLGASINFLIYDDKIMVYGTVFPWQAAEKFPPL
jgi:hypothetical protein